MFTMNNDTYFIKSLKSPKITITGQIITLEMVFCLESKKWEKIDEVPPFYTVPTTTAYSTI